MTTRDPTAFPLLRTVPSACACGCDRLLTGPACLSVADAVWIAAGCNDNTVRLWRRGTHSSPSGTRPGDTVGLLAVGNADGTIFLFDLSMYEAGDIRIGKPHLCRPATKCRACARWQAHAHTTGA